MRRTIVIRRDYLHYVRKFKRFEKIHTSLQVHCSPCLALPRPFDRPWSPDPKPEPYIGFNAEILFSKRCAHINFFFLELNSFSFKARYIPHLSSLYFSGRKFWSCSWFSFFSWLCFFSRFWRFDLLFHFSFLFFFWLIISRSCFTEKLKAFFKVSSIELKWNSIVVCCN